MTRDGQPLVYHSERPQHDTALAIAFYPPCRGEAFPTPSFPSPFPLEAGPLNPARGSGGAL